MLFPDRKCLIISGGELSPLPETEKAPDYVIACDIGWQHAEKLHITPDIVIGDFDSSPLPDNALPTKTYPKEKDDTDTMLAARYALDLGYRDITICCAFGKRADHALGNIQTASFIVSNGGEAALIGRDTYAYAFTDTKRVFPRLVEYSFSVLALSDRCCGVNISGSLYDCEETDFTNSFPLGISNGWRKDTIEVSVRSGILLVVESRL